MSDLFIPVLLGTARPGRRSELVASHVLDTVKQQFGATEFIDVAYTYWFYTSEPWSAHGNLTGTPPGGAR